MDRCFAERIEQGVDFAAAVVFAAAVGYATLRFGFSPSMAALAAAVALLAGSALLRSIGPALPTFALEPFEAAPIPEATRPAELLLTDSDRLILPAPEEDELVLDDVLARLEDFSRVVHLFDASAMPTPGELKQRIDRHRSQSEAPDGSRALHDALADLRRTLR